MTPSMIFMPLRKAFWHLLIRLSIKGSTLIVRVLVIHLHTQLSKHIGLNC
uniref:Uncharacterized protein n=1 Tax=Arundo donax TaxID=35708 RepID=A0A0A9AZW6_ARUDO